VPRFFCVAAFCLREAGPRWRRRSPSEPWKSNNATGPVSSSSLSLFERAPLASRLFVSRAYLTVVATADVCTAPVAVQHNANVLVNHGPAHTTSLPATHTMQVLGANCETHVEFGSIFLRIYIYFFFFLTLPQCTVLYFYCVAYHFYTPI